VVLGLFVEPYSLAKLSAKTQDGDRGISSLSETAARTTKYKKDLGFSSHGELDTEHFAFVCILLIRHAGGWLADVLSLGPGLTTCYNGRRCISAKVVL